MLNRMYRWQVLYGVPYSEHSSFRELRAMVRGIPARQIIPTVHNGGGPDSTRRLVALLTASGPEDAVGIVESLGLQVQPSF